MSLSLVGSAEGLEMLVSLQGTGGSLALLGLSFGGSTAIHSYTQPVLSFSTYSLVIAVACQKCLDPPVDDD